MTEAAAAPAALPTPDIDGFCDALWLEHGLAKNSLDAYRRDLRLFAGWLEAKRGCASLHAVQPPTSPPTLPSATTTPSPARPTGGCRC
jgi:site-specific recombinase XerC